MADPDTLYLQMQTIQLKHATTDTLSLPVGEYQITVIAKGYEDRQAQFIIQPETMSSYVLQMSKVTLRENVRDLSSYPYFEWAKTIHVETDTDSKIEVNGIEIEGSDWMMLAEPGWVEIKVIHRYGRIRTVRAPILENRLNSLDMHVRMTLTEHLVNSLLPGYSHYRKQQYVRMVAAPMALIGVLGLYAHAHVDYLALRDDYVHLRRQYLTAVPSEVDALALRAKQKADEVNSAHQRRNQWLASSLATYVVIFADGVRPGAIGYRKGGMRLDPYVESNPNGDGFLPGFKLSRSF